MNVKNRTDRDLDDFHAQREEGGEWCLLEQQPVDHAQHSV